jgi:hypothetical protein
MKTKILKKFVITLFFFSAFSAYPQYFKGYVVKNNNDTIQCKFRNVSNMFWEEIFTPYRVRYFVKIETLNGEKIKFKPSEIKCFVIKNVEKFDLLTLPKKDLKFVSLEADGLNNFYLENFVGKISSYSLFDSDINARLKTKDFYFKNNELNKIRSLSRRVDV